MKKEIFWVFLILELLDTALHPLGQRFPVVVVDFGGWGGKKFLSVVIGELDDLCAQRFEPADDLEK